MLEILENIISVLTTDATLTALVPASNILTGPVDIVTEANADLLMPQINVFVASEASRSVPMNTRDTIIQIDIWSINSQIEVENIYERIITLLNYTSPTQGSAKVFWNRLQSGVDTYESDRRVWHKASSFVVWSQKP